MNEQDLLDLIKQRHSSRGPFDPDHAIDPDALHLILAAATWAPTAHNMQNFKIIVVRDKTVLAQLGDLESQTSPTFVQENYRQLSFSEEELTAKKTGLLASQFPPAWLTDEAQQGQLQLPPSPLGSQVSDGPVLLMIVTDPRRRAPDSPGDFLGHISLGCMIENMWLMATALGIDFHIISTLGNQPLADDVKQVLDVPPELDIVFGCRLGYATGRPANSPRVRRELVDFVSPDKFGAPPLRNR